MDDNNNYNQAKELIREAELKIKGSCCSNLFKSYSQRRLEALDNYEKAANLFKLSNKWKEAGETYETVAEIKENDQEDATSDYEEAAFCYGKFDLKKQNEIYLILIDIYERTNNFSQVNLKINKVAKIKYDMAEFEAISEHFDSAIQLYKKSAEYYQMDINGNKKKRNEALLKAADLMCMIDYKDTYIEASRIYQDVAMEFLKIPVLVFCAYEIALKCVCVHLAYEDAITGEAFLTKFSNEEFTFANSDEYRILRDIIEAIKQNNSDQFLSATSCLKSKKGLEKWKIPIFNRIRCKISDGPFMVNQSNNKDGVVIENFEIDWK